MMQKSLFQRAIYALLIGVSIAPIRPDMLAAGVISPIVDTKNTLSNLESRIQTYAAEHKELPQVLSDLPVRPNRNDVLTDGWGKPIVYSPQKDGSVLLIVSGESPSVDARSIRFSIVPDKEEDQDAVWTTFNNMDSTETLLREYAAAHSRLPDKLSDIPGEQAPDKDGFTIDAWGQRFEYTQGGGGKVTLRSRGKTGSKQIYSSEFIIARLNGAGPTTATTQQR
jgi:hypothetical protein